MPAAESELRILSPTGVCGSGFIESSFEKALTQKPDFIGCDACSTDPGPDYLGSGRTAFPKDAVHRDLRLMLLGARRLGIPLLIGSAGPAGADVQLAGFCVQGKDIAAAEGLKFKLALIHSALRTGETVPAPEAAQGADQATASRAGIQRSHHRPQ